MGCYLLFKRIINLIVSRLSMCHINHGLRSPLFFFIIAIFTLTSSLDSSAQTSPTPLQYSTAKVAPIILSSGGPTEFLLSNYLESSPPTVAPTDQLETTNLTSIIWSPYTHPNAVISGNKKSHWYRFKIINTTDKLHAYVLSITPSRLLIANISTSIVRNGSTIKKTVHNYYRKTSPETDTKTTISIKPNSRAIIIIELVSDMNLISEISLRKANSDLDESLKERNLWLLINGIFIGILFYVISAAIVSRQSGMLWLIVYTLVGASSSTSFAAHNFQAFSFSAEQIGKLSVIAGGASTVLFIGVLKYIFLHHRILKTISNVHIIIAFVTFSALLWLLPLALAHTIMIPLFFCSIFFTFYISINAYSSHTDPPIIAASTGLLKLALLLSLVWALYERRAGNINTSTLHYWAVSTLLLEAALFNILIMFTYRNRRDAALALSIETAKKEAEVAIISPLLSTSRHELRAPLADIIGLSELIVDSPLDQDQRKYILEIQRSSHIALNKINDIFSFQKQVGTKKYRQEPFNLNNLLSECAQYYAHRADELKKEIVIHISDQTPNYWTGDHEKIRQLLMHMFEYFLTVGDFLELYIEATPHENNSLTFIFSMQIDDSEGEESLVAPNILSIAKSLVQKLDGKLVTTQRESKQRINISIPATANINQSRQHSDVGLLKRKRIIVIDDNPTVCNVIESYLTQWDIETFKANNFHDALAIIRYQSDIECPIDLALIDYVMPINNGMDIAKSLRSDPTAPDNTAIIIMSNAAQLIDPVMAKNYGVNRILEKPVLAQTLKLVLLEEFYFLKSLEKDYSVTRSLLSEMPSTLINDNPPLLLLVEDNAVSATIVCAMLKELNIPYHHAASSREALEFFQVHPYNIVLMDCQLPDETGFETARMFRKIEKQRNMNKAPILIAALTAYDDHENLQKSLDAGMNQYFVKPINLMQLKSLLQQI